MHVTENSLKENPEMVEKQLKNKYVTYMFFKTYWMTKILFQSWKQMKNLGYTSWVYSGSGT